MEGVRKNMAEGRAGASFARTFIEESKLNPNEPFDFMEAASTLGTLSVAAVYTVSSPLQTFVRAAVLHPKWFRKVQDEIDLVCGQERMPEVSDSPLLPALRAFIKECLRWRPPIPTGISHELEEDDVYEGCFVPKVTRVHPLEWAFLVMPRYTIRHKSSTLNAAFLLHFQPRTVNHSPHIPPFKVSPLSVGVEESARVRRLHSKSL